MIKILTLFIYLFPFDDLFIKRLNLFILENLIAIFQAAKAFFPLNNLMVEW